MDANGTANGAVQNVPRGIEELLTAEPLTTGYKPSIPLWMYGVEGFNLPHLYILRDIEVMLIHPMVRSALNYFKSGIAGAQFWGGADPLDPTGETPLPICAENPEVDAFVQEQCQRYWQRGVPKLQAGYEYGWIGCENEYTQEDRLEWNDLVQFSPRDTFLLTQGDIPIGVRVKNIRDKNAVDLWFASGKIPAKAIWYAHQPRYNLHYGQSQLFGAWKPWRRLASKDAAETVIDGGVYRWAYPGLIVRYPEEDLQAQPGVPGTSLDSQGNPRRFARDLARQMCEMAKAGTGFGLPSTKYHADAGGGDKWAVEVPKSTINVEGLIAYAKMLKDEISHGIGVPPELLQAAETGSGYSGRAIPVEAFLNGQQQIADAFLYLFVQQVLKPLVLWNWGPVRWRVQVKSLIKTKANQQGKSQQAPPQENVLPGAQPPGQEGGPGWEPHVGETGQQGWQSQGGAVRYQPQMPGAGFSLDGVTDRVRAIAQKIMLGWDGAMFAWNPYQGTKGGHGWQNTQTGEVRYQQEKPDDDEHAEQQHVAVQKQAFEKFRELSADQLGQLMQMAEKMQGTQKTAKPKAEQSAADPKYKTAFEAMIKGVGTGETTSQNYLKQVEELVNSIPTEQIRGFFKDIQLAQMPKSRKDAVRMVGQVLSHIVESEYKATEQFKRPNQPDVRPEVQQAATSLNKLRGGKWDEAQVTRQVADLIKPLSPEELTQVGRVLTENKKATFRTPEEAVGAIVKFLVEEKRQAEESIAY